MDWEKGSGTVEVSLSYKGEVYCFNMEAEPYTLKSMYRDPIPRSPTDHSPSSPSRPIPQFLPIHAARWTQLPQPNFLIPQIDSKVLGILNSLLAAEEPEKLFYATWDGGQGVIVFFCTKEWKEQFEKKTGLELVCY